MAQQQTQQPDSAMFWRWVGASIRPAAGWVLAGFGALMLLLGWLGVSREVLVAKQLPYLISGGFGGLAFVFLGAKLLSTQDLRRYEDRLGHLEALVDDLHTILLAESDDETLEAQASPFGAPTGNGAGPNVVILPSGQSFHRPDCSMVQGKAGTQAIAAGAAQDRGMTPCRLCQPLTADLESARA